MFDWALNKGKGEQQEAAEEARRETVKAWRDQGARRRQVELQKEFDAVYERGKKLTAELLVERERVSELEALCKRAADVIEVDIDSAHRDERETLRSLVRELREA
jgi:hypothetical protein